MSRVASSVDGDLLVGVAFSAAFFFGEREARWARGAHACSRPMHAMQSYTPHGANATRAVQEGRAGTGVSLARGRHRRLLVFSHAVVCMLS